MDRDQENNIEIKKNPKRTFRNEKTKNDKRDTERYTR